MNIWILIVLLLSAVSGFTTAMLALQFILLTTEKGHHNLRKQFREMAENRFYRRLGPIGRTVITIAGNLAAWMILAFIVHLEMAVTDNLPTVFLLVHAVTWCCMFKYFKWWNREMFGFAQNSF